MLVIITLVHDVAEIPVIALMEIPMTVHPTGTPMIDHLPAEIHTEVPVGILVVPDAVLVIVPVPVALPQDVQDVLGDKEAIKIF